MVPLLTCFKSFTRKLLVIFRSVVAVWVERRRVCHREMNKNKNQNHQKDESSLADTSRARRSNGQNRPNKSGDFIGWKNASPKPDWSTSRFMTCSVRSFDVHSSLAEYRSRISYYKSPRDPRAFPFRNQNLFARKIWIAEKKKKKKRAERKSRQGRRRRRKRFVVVVRHGRLLESSRVSDRARNRYLRWVFRYLGVSDLNILFVIAPCDSLNAIDLFLCFCFCLRKLQSSKLMECGGSYMICAWFLYFTVIDSKCVRLCVPEFRMREVLKNILVFSVFCC